MTGRLPLVWVAAALAAYVAGVAAAGWMRRTERAWVTARSERPAG